jgi:hypothetical protein
MSSYDLPLSRIDAAYLDSLRADAVAEGRQLEYKEQLPAENDDEPKRDESKREFLRDVTSFANSVGGDLALRGARGPRRRRRVSEVVKVDLWCGGDIQVACIRKAGDGYTLERKRSADIRKCAIDLADTDTKIKRSHRRMFLGGA